MTFSITAWTDGSAYWRTKEGGWCSILAAMRDDVSEKDIADLVHLSSKCLSPTRTDIEDFDGSGRLRAKVSVLRGYAINTTNNRMEMRAIIEAVRAVTKPCTMRIVSDSEWAIGAFTTYNVKANLDLVDLWRRTSSGFKIVFEHIDGHSGNPLNEWADTIADYKNNPNLTS